MTYTSKVYHKVGAEELVVASGGKVTVESGGSIDVKAGGSLGGAGDLSVTGSTTLANTILAASTTTQLLGDMTVGAQAKITEADTHAMYNGNQFYRIAVARFTPKTVAGSRVQGAHGLGIYIPDNAIVTKAYYHVVEQPTSANSLAQIAIHVNAANDIQTATVITDAKFTAGIKAGIPVGTAATMIKTTAKREITATVSVEDLTAAGIINIYVEYVLTSTA